MTVGAPKQTPTPTEPGPASLLFPDPLELPSDEWVVGVSRNMSAAMVLAAYRQGIFPWPTSQGRIPWCSPNPRAIYPLERPPQWPRSVRRAVRELSGLTVSFDRAFLAVLDACADRSEGTWITGEVRRTYGELHRLGWAHSAEVWDGDFLVGGLYGLAIGNLFAGESMFHRRTGASKLAFVSMAERLHRQGFGLFDVQVQSEHLRSLGCEELPRREFLARLGEAIQGDARF